MTLLLVSLGLLLASGTAAWVLSSHPRVAAPLGAAGPIAALLCALPAIGTVLSGATLHLELAPHAPLGALALGLDPLSAFFLLIVLTIGAAAAVFGLGYLPRDATASASWLFFDVLVASMTCVVLARQVVVFLVAWETMALTSFMLVAYHHERATVRRAAWTYLVAAHLGSLFLLPMFFILGGRAGSMDFASLGQGLTAGGAQACFLLAVVGFGTKAGLMPFHVWLPEAHPVAPSHVSALLSAVMLKMGVYGLLRTLLWLGPPPLAWGWLLTVLGCASALLGVLLALAQHDLKRLLAYSSVENAGIVVCGIGVGVIGLASGSATVAILGFAAALVHAGNHAVFKALLFLGAGSVLHAAGTTDIDVLGGAIRRLPRTALAMLVGALGICGLPPLNGFVGEFLLYLAAIDGIRGGSVDVAAPLVMVVGALAMTGALALAGLAKAFGIVFLGRPRRPVADAHPERRLMTVPMVGLASLCVLLGVLAPLTVGALAPAIAQIAGRPGRDEIAWVTSSLTAMTGAAMVPIALGLVIMALRRISVWRKEVRSAPTWGCGYPVASTTMQYTGSSFSQPIVDLFGSLLRTRKRVEPPEVHFPAAARVATETPDLSREGIYEPAFEAVERGLRRAHVLQHGSVHVYVLGILLTLVVLLLWQVR